VRALATLRAVVEDGAGAINVAEMAAVAAVRVGLPGKVCVCVCMFACVCVCVCVYVRVYLCVGFVFVGQEVRM